MVVSHWSLVITHSSRVTYHFSFKKLFQKAFFLGIRSLESQVPADGDFKGMLIHIGPFHDDFISNHDGRRCGKIQLKIFVRYVFCFGFGCDLHVDFILLSQHGDHLFEMLSRLSVRLVVKEMNFKHDQPPYFYGFVFFKASILSKKGAGGR